METQLILQDSKEALKAEAMEIQLIQQEPLKDNLKYIQQPPQVPNPRAPGSQKHHRCRLQMSPISLRRRPRASGRKPQRWRQRVLCRQLLASSQGAPRRKERSGQQWGRRLLRAQELRKVAAARHGEFRRHGQQ